jgi:hypothetical protein
MDLTKLGELYKELTKKKEQFQAMMEAEGLLDLQAEIGELEKQVGKMAIEFGNEVPEKGWKPDAFSKGKKDIFFEGTTGILRTTREIRDIIPEKMVEEQPILTNVLVEEGKVKFYLKDVEPRITEEELEDIIERKTQRSYEVVLRKAPKEKEKKKIKAKA